MSAALLVCDVQQGLVDAVPGGSDVVEAVTEVVQRARAAGVAIVWVSTVLRDDGRDVHPRNRAFAAARDSGLFTTGSSSARLHSSLPYEDGDLEVVKRRVSPFTGTELDVVLRSSGVAQVAVAGLTTGGVVLSCVRSAADRDYGVTVLRDCCSDPNPELHRLLVDELLPGQADVVTSSEWLR